MKQENIDRANILDHEASEIIRTRTRIQIMLATGVKKKTSFSIEQDDYHTNISVDHNKEDIFAILRKEEKRLTERLAEIDEEFAEL